MFRVLVVIGVFVLSYALPVSAEKYFTWVDENGRVNHTVIPEEDNPLIKPEDSGEVKQSNPFVEADNTADDMAPVVQPKANNTSAVKSNNDTPETDIKSSINTSQELSQEPVLKSKPSSKVEINEEDYIDGDVLLEQGNIRKDSDLPYYTWTDERGIVRNTPYRPKVSQTDNAKNAKAPIVPTKIDYTVHDEYKRPIPQAQQTSSTELAPIDDYAQSLFFSHQADDFVSIFSQKCCVDLPKETPSILNVNESVYIELDRKSEKHQFSEGTSYYSLVELPKTQQVYSLSFKTFVKSSGKTGVKNGVFYPQLVFLNDQYQAMRIVRNPVLEYKPENWHRHGYLKGLFEIDGSENERYILINTTKENLSERNRIEGKKAITLKNQKIGSFELEALQK